MVRLLRYFAALSTLSLMACADIPAPVVREVPFVPDVPPELFACPGAPQPPADGATQRDVAVYILDLHEAHADCRADLGAVEQVLMDARQRVESKE